MSVKCSQCQTKLLPNYPKWLRLVHMFEFLRYQELISETLYNSCMDDLMSVKYAVDIMDEQREQELEHFYDKPKKAKRENKNRRNI